MHIIKAFTHLQVQNIPEKYILKRYTRNARSMVPWDRHDVSVGGQNEIEQSRLLKLLPKLMRLGRARSKSDRAYTETIRHIDMITPRIELLRTSEIGPDEATNTELQQNADGRRNIGPIAPTQQSSENNMEPVVMPTGPTTPPESDLNPGSANFLADLTLTELAVSRMKGRKSASGAKGAKNSVEPANPYSTYSGVRA
jgi:hypothetical protein